MTMDEVEPGTLDQAGDEKARSFNTDHAASRNTSTVLTQPHQPELNAYKSTFSWSDIDWEDKGEAIIDASDSSLSEAAWPTVIHAGSVLDSPIDEWYCYWSTHDSNDLALSTAPSPWGPWSFHSEFFSDPEGSQTSSPSAVVVPEDGQINLYYHVDPNFDGSSGAGKQFTKVATAPLSGDGTNFTVQGTALDAPRNGLWDDHERSYMTVVRHGKGFIAAYQGRDRPSNIKGVGIAHSFDGLSFVKSQQNPAFDNTQWGNPNPKAVAQGAAPALSFLGGELTIHYGDNQDDVARALPYALHETAPFQQGEVVYTPPAWFDDGDYPAVQDFVADRDYVYMIYYREPNSGGRAIGVARAAQGEIL